MSAWRCADQPLALGAPGPPQPRSGRMAPLAADSHTLWAQVYKEFQALYEGKLEEFLASKNIDHVDFATACKAALDKGDANSDKAFVTILLSMAEYQYFVKMMCEMAGGADTGGAE